MRRCTSCVGQPFQLASAAPAVPGAAPAEGSGSSRKPASVKAAKHAALVKDKDYGGAYAVRISALNALGKMGPLAAPHVPAIAALLKDKNSGVRGSAVEALSALGELAAPYVPAIAALLKDKEWGVSSYAVKALGAIG